MLKFLSFSPAITIFCLHISCLDKETDNSLILSVSKLFPVEAIYFI